MNKFKPGDIVQNRDGINKYQILELQLFHGTPNAYLYKVISHYTHYPEETHGYYKNGSPYPKDSTHWECYMVIDENFELDIKN